MVAAAAQSQPYLYEPNRGSQAQPSTSESAPKGRSVYDRHDNVFTLIDLRVFVPYVRHACMTRTHVGASEEVACILHMLAISTSCQFSSVYNGSAVHVVCVTNLTAHAPYTLVHHLCGVKHLDYDIHSVQ